MSHCPWDGVCGWVPGSESSAFEGDGLSLVLFLEQGRLAVLSASRRSGVLSLFGPVLERCVFFLRFLCSWC